MVNIRDYQIDPELENLLREIYDDDEFIVCTTAMIRGKEDKMIDFLEIAKERNDKVSYEDIVALSLILNSEAAGE